MGKLMHHPDRYGENRPEGVIELLSFRLCGQEYSVDIMSVREIRSWTKATPLPHAPPYMRGVINLRGTVLPVVDLGLRLELDVEGEPDARSVIVVVDIGDRTVGLRVDAVSDILAIPMVDLQLPPEIGTDEGTGFIRALTLVDDRMVRVLELDAVLPQSEVAA